MHKCSQANAINMINFGKQHTEACNFNVPYLYITAINIYFIQKAVKAILLVIYIYPDDMIV
jgi:hypothetical protein